MAVPEQRGNAPPLALAKLLPQLNVAPWHHKQFPRSRWVLHFQASFWRFLMQIGMRLHRLAPPRPPHPDYVRQIPATVSGKSGNIDMHFYVPKDYEVQKRLYNEADEEEVEEDNEVEAGQQAAKNSKKKERRISATINTIGQSIRRRSSVGRRWGSYPVVINFHGGGFTLGLATDDARWCTTVREECNAVVISVDYRLAPEHPFPTAVEDGVDVVLWVHQHAQELGIDPDKIALSGFSSGANMCFTVPLRLYDELHGYPHARRSIPSRSPSPSAPPTTGHLNVDPAGSNPASSSSNLLPPGAAGAPESTNPYNATPVTSQGFQDKSQVAVTSEELPGQSASVCCVVSWYPSADYTRSREQRRESCLRKDQELPTVFTDLFDESYLHPPQNITLDSPYLSPGVAPSKLLQDGLPDEIVLTTCEWDMLLEEAAVFKDRLIELGKKVNYEMVPGVPHAWDKAPTWKPIPGVRSQYLRACKELKRVFSN